MSKKTRCRVLSLLLALVMVLGMVPMASASSAYNVKLTETTPDESKLSTAIQQNKFKLQNGEEAYADNDTVRAIVIFEGDAALPAALNKSSVATQSAVAAAAKSLVSQHSRIKTAIKQEAVNYDVKYEYTTLLNGMSTDVKFGDLEKLANTAGVKEVYLANYYDEPVVIPSMDSANDMTNITKVRGKDTGKGTVTEHKMFAKNDPGSGWGCNEGRIKPMPITISNCQTKDGKIVIYASEAKFTDDPIEDGYFGCGGVAEIPHLQDKCITLAKGGFKHHTAICEGHYKDILKEAFTTYLGYEWVDIDG